MYVACKVVPEKLNQHKEGSSTAMKPSDEVRDFSAMSIDSITLPTSNSAIDIRGDTKTPLVLDVYIVEPRRPSVVGGVLTLLVLPATVAYAIFLYFVLAQSPPITTATDKWTVVDQPFTMLLKCGDHPDGCLMSNTYKANASSHYCQKLAPNEEVEVSMGFSYSAFDGLSVLAYTNSPIDAIAFTLNEAYDPKQPTALKDGTFLYYGPFSAGTSVLQYVRTTNYTITGRGHRRNEWFITQVSTEAHLQVGSTPCVLPNASWTQARVRMLASWIDVNVESSLSVTAWFGTASGVYAALISWGGFILSMWESLKNYRILGGR